jgi:hypothetical protein
MVARKEPVRGSHGTLCTIPTITIRRHHQGQANTLVCLKPVLKRLDFYLRLVGYGRL